MNLGEFDSLSGMREGEAPAEPPQPHMRQYPIRRHPASGVLASPYDPTIVYLTVCTKDRIPWLATPEVHSLLISTLQKAQAWRVGRYVIMPDHLHLFTAWIDGSIELDNWVRYWKSQFSKRNKGKGGEWQTGHWDTRLRGVKAYESKWEYVRNNPVRHKLVTRAEDWPYQGELFLLDWNG
jgi:REP element-mobilizing transposase RayT